MKTTSKQNTMQLILTSFMLAANSGIAIIFISTDLIDVNVFDVDVHLTVTSQNG